MHLGRVGLGWLGFLGRGQGEEVVSDVVEQGDELVAFMAVEAGGGGGGELAPVGLDLGKRHLGVAGEPDAHGPPVVGYLLPHEPATDIVEQPMAGPLAYAVAKGALETAARVLAVREARHGILTNVVRPGFTLTERARTSALLGPAAVEREAAHTPTGRICTPHDVACAVTYVGSTANGHINGQVLSVAGGRELVR